MATTSAPARAEGAMVKSLPNGTLWIHKPVKHNGIMAFHLFFPSGAAQEPAPKAGLTTLMTTLLFKGTEKRSSLELAQAVESLGAALDADADEDYWNISGQSTSERFEALLGLFREVLLEPSFPEEEFQKEKKALLNAIQSKREQIFDVAHDLLLKELFQEHPYGRPAEGTAETVSNLVRKDVIDWHKQCALPKGTVLVTCGNIPPAKLEVMVMKALEGWSSPNSPPAPPGRAESSAKPRLKEEKHPFEQSYLMLAYHAPALGEKDYVPLKIMNAMLGGGMSSPLFRVVREEGSLAYEVSAFYPTRRRGSAVVVYAGTDPRNLDLAERKVAELIKEFPRTAVTDEDVENAKRYIKGNYLMDHQTNSRVAWYLGWWQIMGLGHEYDSLYPQDIQAVSRISVQQAAERLFAQPTTTIRIRSAKDGKQ